MGNLLSKATAQNAELAREIAAADGAKIGAAAERKRQEEAADSLAAALESHAANGRAIRWQRRIRANGETRAVAMFERADAYGERELIRLANRAAAAAVPGGWRNAEAVEAIGAEIVLAVLAKTDGRRMPKRGSLGQTVRADDADDFRYLVTIGRRRLADSLRGEANGLAAEVAPMAAAEGAYLLEIAAADAERAADTDRYIGTVSAAVTANGRRVSEWTAADWRRAERAAERAERATTDTAAGAIKRAAVELGDGERPAAVAAAIVSALRWQDTAATLADAGYGANASAHRKSASLGRGILARGLAQWRKSARLMTADDWRRAEALAILSEEETAERESRHICEQAKGAIYRAPDGFSWPQSREADGTPTREPRGTAAERMAGALK